MFCVNANYSKSWYNQIFLNELYTGSFARCKTNQFFLKRLSFIVTGLFTSLVACSHSFPCCLLLAHCYLTSPLYPVLRTRAICAGTSFESVFLASAALAFLLVLSLNYQFYCFTNCMLFSSCERIQTSQIAFHTTFL